MTRDEMTILRRYVADGSQMPQDFRVAIRELLQERDALAAEIAQMRAALIAWRDWAKEAERPINACISVSAIHGVPYPGPNWTEAKRLTNAVLPSPTTEPQG